MQHIDIAWPSSQHRNLTYKTDIFKDNQQITKWKNAGLNLDNLTIDLHQIDSPYDWMDPVIQSFNFLTDVKFCFHRLLPGHYIPMHYDLYGFYQKQHDIKDIESIHRYIIFLEDAADGHYLQIANTVYHNWTAGEYVGWQGTTMHAALNFGITNRYTLQITGDKIIK